MNNKITTKEDTGEKKQAIKEKTKSSVYMIITLMFGAVSFLLLFPSLSGLRVFAKGDFVYIESLGFTFAYVTVFLIVLCLIMKKFSFQTIKNKLVRCFVFITITGISILLLLFVITFVWIRFDVKQQCLNAKNIYGNDCVGALINLVKDEGRDFKARNSAIWALGQLADNRALPFLQSIYTGNIPLREPLDKTISQYELKKAITWCEKGNITSWMYGSQSNWR